MCEIPFRPAKRPAAAKCKSEWSPHTSDGSEQPAEQGLSRLQGEKVNSRGLLTQALHAVPSQDGLDNPAGVYSACPALWHYIRVPFLS